jgi:Family of unknown function (DUF5995)
MMADTSRAFDTMDDAVAGLAALEARYRERNDRRAIFLTLYGIVSSEMRARVAARSFEDNAWVERYTVAFANLYREALVAYEAGDPARVAKAWRLCFDAAAAGNGLVLQDMLLGVNAHVNHDLPLALSAISIDPDRERRYRDHSAVNAVLGSVVERATERLAGLYAPGLRTVDDCAGPVDELLSAFSLEIARESAWEGAVSLANARNAFERVLVVRLMGTRAAAVARLLLAPSRHAPLISACRRVEQGTGWLALLGDAAT